ncbi:MAG: hypothetical protein KJ065_25225 [Anaerolineae bacterium]|nr:hypothetical protein [Anaerolineae bacterium]
MMRRLTVILAAIMWFALPAMAQDGQQLPVPPLPTETPTPVPTITPSLAPTLAVTTEGFVYSADAEVIFPVGIRFTTIILQRLEGIAGLSLRIEVENRAAETINIDMQEALVSDFPNPEFAYVWQIDAANPPLLFSEIHYVWTVRNTGGVTNVGEGTLQFTDSRTPWQRRESQSRPFDLTAPTSVNLSQLSRSLDTVYDLMAANTERRPALNIVLYDSAINVNNCAPDAEGELVAVGQTTGTVLPCPVPDLGEQIIARSGYDIVYARLNAFNSSQDAISSSLFDAFYLPMWTDRDVPQWFVDGLRRLYTPTAKDALLAPAASAARSNTLFSLSEMAAAPQDETLRSRWNAQAYSMVLYLADTLGLPAVYDLAQTADTTAFATAYQAATGLPPDSLIPLVRDWLVSPRASAAFRVVLYGEPTAIPSPSPTFTAFPPTRTQRPEPSATATATITLTPTPRPTHTPTPSVTPRPPGSLDTATPIPVQTQPPLIESGSRSSILAVLIIVIAVLVIAFARVGNR